MHLRSALRATCGALGVGVSPYDPRFSTRVRQPAPGLGALPTLVGNTRLVESGRLSAPPGVGRGSVVVCRTERSPAGAPDLTHQPGWARP